MSQPPPPPPPPRNPTSYSDPSHARALHPPPPSSSEPSSRTTPSGVTTTAPSNRTTPSSHTPVPSNRATPSGVTTTAPSNRTTPSSHTPVPSNRATPSGVIPTAPSNRATPSGVTTSHQSRTTATTLNHHATTKATPTTTTTTTTTSSTTTTTTTATTTGNGGTTRNPTPSEGARALVAPLSTHAAHESRHGYQVKMRFRTRLPEPPIDCKLLPVPLDNARLVRYAPFSLEREAALPAAAEPFLGIRVNAFDAAAIAALQLPSSGLSTTSGPSLPSAPASVASLYALPNASLASRVDDLVHQARSRNRALEKDPIFSMDPVAKSTEVDLGHEWLLPQTYYQPIDEPTRKRKSTMMDESAVTEVKIETPEDIERSFAEAQKTPVHPTDPNLKPVSVTPIFPDFDRFSNRYTYVFFNPPPIPQAKLNSNVDRLHDKAKQSVMMIYSAHDKLMTYMLPKNPDQKSESGSAVSYVTHSDIKFEKEAETSNQRNFVFIHDQDKKIVYYTDVAKFVAKSIPKRRKGHMRMDILAEYPRPERMDVRTVPLPDKNKRQVLQYLEENIYYGVTVPQHVLDAYAVEEKEPSEERDE
eukprot:TRINITY_DN1190_c0_g1_i1.p1 TRINITY_DN1190_c0_g1~~TRINITY_DN1190_c0_g1_i1.p1  ORF type:complete len:586 (+),score=116.88 TRINITY_DN1190_c0_g1_i1:218-1975(+)